MAKKVMTLKELKALHESNPTALEVLKAKNNKVIAFAMADEEIGEEACAAQVAENALIDRILTGRSDTNEASELLKKQSAQLNEALHTKYTEGLATQIGTDNEAKLLSEGGLVVRMRLVDVPTLDKKKNPILAEDGKTPVTHKELVFEAVKLKAKATKTEGVSTNASGEKRPTPYEAFVVNGKKYDGAGEAIEATRTWLRESAGEGANPDFKLPDSSFSKPRYLAQNLAKQWQGAGIYAIVKDDRREETAKFCADNEITTTEFEGKLAVELSKHYTTYTK